MTIEKPQEMAGETNSIGSVTNKDNKEQKVHRTTHPLIDTDDSSSSRFSVDLRNSRSVPPSGTYVVELPRENIFRVPPPENAARYQYLSRRKTKQSNCRRCCCYSLAALVLLLFLTAIAAGVLFLIYRPQKPRFSVSEISITRINLTLTSPISPVIEVKLRFENVNSKLGLIYEKGNEAEIFYEGIKLGNGKFTAFKQPVNNVTMIVTVLKGKTIPLSSSTRKRWKELEQKGEVPFGLGIKSPVKFKIGAVTTWTLTVKVDCKMIVDKLTESATVVTETCDTGLSLL